LTLTKGEGGEKGTPVFKFIPEGRGPISEGGEERKGVETTLAVAANLRVGVEDVEKEDEGNGLR